MLRKIATQLKKHKDVITSATQLAILVSLGFAALNYVRVRTLDIIHAADPNYDAITSFTLIAIPLLLGLLPPTFIIIAIIVYSKRMIETAEKILSDKITANIFHSINPDLNNMFDRLISLESKTAQQAIAINGENLDTVVSGLPAPKSTSYASILNPSNIVILTEGEISPLDCTIIDEPKVTIWIDNDIPF